MEDKKTDGIIEEAEKEYIEEESKNVILDKDDDEIEKPINTEKYKNYIAKKGWGAFPFL